MTLTNKILCSLLAIGFITALLAQLEGWRVENDQQKQIEAQAADLKQLFRQFAVLPAILATDPRLSLLLTEQDQQKKTALMLQANNILRLATNRSDAAFAFLMDDTGLTVAASNYDQSVSFIGKNYGFRPYFTKAMAGSVATYFAVGATTGIPGYFVSEPIKQHGKILGVIAVKLEPQRLPESWASDNTIALVTDELGVTILSTDNRLLYNRTRKLDSQALQLIEDERRYSLEDSGYLDAQNGNRWRHVSTQGNSYAAYRVSSIPLDIEPWSLSLLTPVRVVHIRVLRDLLLLTGVFLVAALLWHAYRQQVRLAYERAKLTERLEQLVDEKTRELEGAQQALIAESNYSMLGKMSAAINHEINQPLASLRLNLATLRHLVENRNAEAKVAQPANEQSTVELDEDSIESTVVDLDRTAKRITRVIETLRALPQQNRSGFVLVDIQQTLLDSISSVKADRKLLSKFLHFDFSQIGTESQYVLGQRILLQQALLNILYNALDAVANVDAPFVLLTASVQANTIEIEVRDNGAGVCPSMESSLFEPFESAPEKISGMGIGLTLARQIITDHGGTLTYHRDAIPTQDAPNGLTVFAISLPLAAA